MSRAATCLVATTLLLLLLLLANKRDTPPQIITVVAPTLQPKSLTPPVILTEDSPSPPSPPQSPWDAELNSRYRALLRLPPLAAHSLQTSADSPPTTHDNKTCVSRCSGHGRCQPARGGARGEWSLRCACDPGWTGLRCERRDAQEEHHGSVPLIAGDEEIRRRRRILRLLDAAPSKQFQTETN